MNQWRRKTKKDDQSNYVEWLNDVDEREKTESQVRETRMK
jgi:hypothetical protein